VFTVTFHLAIETYHWVSNSVPQSKIFEVYINRMALSAIIVLIGEYFLNFSSRGTNNNWSPLEKIITQMGYANTAV